MAVAETDGTVTVYKDGQIGKRFEGKIVNIMGGGGGEPTDDNVAYTQPNYVYEPYEIDKRWFLEKIKIGTSLRDETRQPIVVAVIDSGVDYKHPEFTGKLWDGSNCVDYTGKYMGDCGVGYNFVDNNTSPLPYNDGIARIDQIYHGTHVAGILAAVSSNIKIMVLRVDFKSETLSRAVLFAEKNGAKIINASWGSKYDKDTGYADRSDPVLTEAIKSFSGIFVNAAGNNAVNHDCGMPGCMPYPAALKIGTSNMIVVAATDINDQLSVFSDYGKDNVDLGAPGTSIYSTYADNGYEYLSGTSMATPMVAGAIAYLWSWKTDFSREEMMNYIIKNSLVLDSLSGKVKSGSRLQVNSNLICVRCKDLKINYVGQDITGGDYNCDGIVTLGDFTVWRNEGIDNELNVPVRSDGDCSGKVTVNDYSWWRKKYLEQ